MSPSDLSALLLAQAWQLAALIGGVLLATRWLGRNRPHLAHALWLVVLLKCITPPLWSSPSGVFCWLQPRQVAAVPYTPAPPPQWLLAERVPELPPDELREVVVALTPVPRDLPVSVLRTAEEPATEWNWPQWLVTIWLGGASLSLAIALVRWRLFLWRLRRFPRREGPELAEFVARLARRLRVGRRVRLLVTESRIGPAVIGLVRPTILLPAAIVAGKSPADLEPILAHELLHVRRGDLWLAAAQVLAQSLWWFHPLVWLANRLLIREAERCCDEQVLAELRCEPARYARSLLEILGQKQTLVAVPAFPGVRPVDVTSNRLERIMRLGHGCRRRTPWWCWLVALLAAAAALPGAAFVAAKEKPAKPKAPPTWAATTAAPAAEPQAAALPEVDASPRVTRVYQVRDLLQKVAEELKLDEATARDDLRGNVIGFARLKDPQLRWDGKKLVATHTEAQHEQIAAALAQLREFGLRQVTLYVQMISGPPELFERIPVQWSTADSALPQAAAATSGAQAAFDFRPLGLPAQTPPGQSWTQATSLVEKSMPVLYAFLEMPQTRDLVRGVQNDARTNILSAPKVTVFNGQRATVTDCTQRPFVVGAKAAAGEAGAAGKFEPQIRIVNEGTILRMRPVLQGKDRVRLEYEFTLASIRSVETAKIPQGTGNKHLTVQVPEVASTRFSTSLELPLGQTLAVGALTKQGTKSGAMLVLLEAHEIDLAAENAALEPAASGKAILPAPRAIAPATYLKDDVQHFPPSPTRGGLSTVVYYVTDLGNLPDSKPGFEPLMKRIRSTVSPKSWQEAGGAGTIAFSEKQKSLVISQTEDVHVRVANLLAGLRQRQKERAAGHATEQALGRNISVTPGQRPLREVLAEIGRASRVSFRIDPEQLAAEGIDAEKRVNVPDRVQPRPAAEWLAELLEPLGLEIRIENEFARVTSRDEPARKIYTQVYLVPDLVLDAPAIVAARSGKAATQQPMAVPNFQTLIDLIVTTIAPQSWDDVGGMGSISAYEANSSLVVSQTRGVHEQIADMLGYMRRSRAQQVVLDLQLVALSETALERAGFDLPLRPADSDTLCAHAVLSPSQAAALADVAETKADAVTRLALMNGQAGDFSLTLAGTERTLPLKFVPRIREDRRSVRLQVAAGKDAELSATSRGTLMQCPAEETLLLDVTGNLTAAGIPLLSKIPHLDRLFKQVGPGGSRVIILVTPRLPVELTKAETKR